MAHALAAHARQRDLDAALLADDALILHTLVFTAQALVILDRPEDARAKQAVALRLEGAIVDRLRLLDLAERPGQNLFRACDRDLNLIECHGGGDGRERIRDFLVHLCISRGCRSSVTTAARLDGNRGNREDSRVILKARARKIERERGRHSAASIGDASPGSFFVEASSTLRPSERISFTSTLKLSGIPDSNVSSPR